MEQLRHFTEKGWYNGATVHSWMSNKGVLVNTFYKIKGELNEWSVGIREDIEKLLTHIRNQHNILTPTRLLMVSLLAIIKMQNILKKFLEHFSNWARPLSL